MKLYCLSKNILVQETKLLLQSYKIYVFLKVVHCLQLTVAWENSDGQFLHELL